jgi:hypothetical protein
MDSVIHRQCHDGNSDTRISTENVTVDAVLTVMGGSLGLLVPALFVLAIRQGIDRTWQEPAAALGRFGTEPRAR